MLRFDAREGGSFRISLTYDAPTGTGKTTASTDTFHGRFLKLVTDEQVVEVVESRRKSLGSAAEPQSIPARWKEACEGN